MQPIIEITSTKTATKSGKARSTGKDYSITSQRGFFQTVDPITGELGRTAIDVPLENADSPYPVGRYSIDATSYRVSEYGTLALSRMKLDPLPAAVASVPQSGKLATAA